MGIRGLQIPQHSDQFQRLLLKLMIIGGLWRFCTEGFSPFPFLFVGMFSIYMGIIYIEK